ncbi:PIG-L deacetylase family protein [Frigoriflavimonas asaccharolytica]|uniref:LmbE family N-acetylglucosaminyl deacetylase n=1 Tax=Frigoriflavimonas asaccharolytica TaxID=2735899 RepID=A0A8J8K4G9_9FLAO|nr:PIG-L deacetylase family protein [Frigoriflavimonas asaccharolytica]NRS91725.1 LmbE family N-acetylglucosaminyl deacetylase [Frigoriflavimonas asaccharolytica]
MTYKKVLVLAPHTDDGELGAGGFISKLIEEGAEVFYMAFSTAEESVPEGFPKDILKTEVVAATKVLGVKEENVLIFNYQVRKLNYVRQEILEELIRFKRLNNDIDLVLIPSLKDIHQDHSTIAMEGVRAFKTKSILSYELIWNNLSFDTQAYISLEEKHINKKIDALKEYKSQGFRDYLSAEFIKSLAIARGVQFGVKYAETFEVVRYAIK